MLTVLWCYLRNSAFKMDGVEYHVGADLRIRSARIVLWWRKRGRILIGR
jgi:DhnA family fructose-bisphosphate aldolase class Ia